MALTRFPLKYKQKIRLQQSINRLEERIRTKQSEVDIDKDLLVTLRDWSKNGLPLDNQLDGLIKTIKGAKS